MRRFRFIHLALLAVPVLLSLSADRVSAATLILKDGAVIHGEILRMSDGEYTVKTESLGTVRVRKDTIRTIDHSGSATLGSNRQAMPATGQTASPEAGEIQALQNQMMQDPGMLSMVQALQNDPEIQAVLADPEIMRAMASGNYAALMNHPKIIALTRNAGVRQVIEKTQ